ncbi:MAG: DUF1501 domain-containing protein [Pseudomonadota bacterium]
MTLSRRQWLARFGAATTAFAAAGPGLSLARAPTERRLLVVMLRGAADGLALIPPYGEPTYPGLRGPLALPAPGSAGGIERIDGLFGVHPSAPWLAARFRERTALAVHAVATPYRARSHFDGQDVLESGSAGVAGLRSGWLNRTLVAFAPTTADRAVALATNTPLILQGDAPVLTWSPSRLPEQSEDTLQRLAALYAEDAFLADRLEQALEARSIAGAMEGRGRQQLKPTLRRAARFLQQPDGARIAFVDSGGWDTHANQGSVAGQFARHLTQLDAGLAGFASTLGALWKQTAVLVMTEFGRTVRVNGTRGTDHGTGAVALLVGGSVAGGRVLGDWPGLARANLYEGRDLKPTTDLRALIKTVLLDHLGVAEAATESTVFPASAAVRPLESVFI